MFSKQNSRISIYLSNYFIYLQALTLVNKQFSLPKQRGVRVLSKLGWHVRDNHNSFL